MKWLVIGGGVSGLGAATFLCSRGEAVRVVDQKPLANDRRQDFTKLNCEVLDNSTALSALDGMDAVVLSPGVPGDNPLVAAARARGLPSYTEIDLALAHYKGTVIAVTGTNGKSTTVVMIQHLLAACGVGVTAGGNLGDPPTKMLAEDRTKEVMVLELSSYQLEFSRLIRPQVAIFTTFSHDHLHRHHSLRGYFMAKWRLFEGLSAEALAIMAEPVFAQAQRYDAFGPLSHRLVVNETHRALAPGTLGFDGTKLIGRGLLLDFAESGIREPHNLMNAAFAVHAAAHVTEREPAALIPLLKTFKPLPHRCEMVGRCGPYAVINDSKSTNVESTLAALKAQREPVILLMGGQGKDEPYTPLAAEKHLINRLIAFGASGVLIANDLRDQIPTAVYPTLATALDALLAAKPSHSVLFSPGCASFDEFRNFEERGDYFKSRVATWVRA